MNPTWRDHGRRAGILSQTAAVIANSRLDCHESAAHLMVVGGINGSALSIAEELVQRVICGTFPDLVVVVEASWVVDGVVHLAIGARRRTGVISSVGLSLRMAVLPRGSHASIRVESTGLPSRSLISTTGAAMSGASVWFGRAKKHRIISVSLHMLLQILRPLEGFAAEVAFVRLKRYMDADMRGNVVAFDRGRPTIAPLACEIQVVGTLTADMAFANVVI